MPKNLTEGSIIKNICVFSIPYLLSCFLQTLYGMADLFIAGQFNGADVISAVSNGSQIMHMVTVMLIGIAMGTTVLTSRAVGARKNDEAAKVIGNTTVLFMIISVVMASVLFACTRGIVEVLQIPVEAVEGTVVYLQICFAGIPLICAYNVIASVYRGLGDSRTPMIFIAVACLVNIGLDYLFMGVFHMGAAGAAIATVLAQGLSVVISLIAFVLKSDGIRMKWSDFKPNGKIIGELLKIGVPLCCQDGFVQISFLVITIIANGRGVLISAAVGVVEKIICFLFLVPSAMLSTVSALAAQNHGAGEHERAKKTLYCGMSIAAVFGIVFGVVFQFASAPVLGLFTDDAQVVVYGTQYLKSYVWDCFFAAFHFSLSGYFCAYGYSMLSFISNVLSIVFVRIPGAWWTSKAFPETLYPMGWAAPMGSLLSSIVSFVFLLFIFRRQRINGEKDRK